MQTNDINGIYLFLQTYITLYGDGISVYLGKMTDTIYKTTGLTTENKTIHANVALGLKYSLDAASDDFDLTLMHNRIGTSSDG